MLSTKLFLRPKHNQFWLRQIKASFICLIILVLLEFYKQNSLIVLGIRMVRLCIASVDPIKLSSQCVMCNRREFPLSAIDCTGITKMNDLISNPLSVQEATCLIYNCRRVSRFITNLLIFHIPYIIAKLMLYIISC